MANSIPKVSVIVPIYGVEKYLKECLDSILNQTMHELEIILIDDGSKDNCPQIVDEYAKKDNRIIAIHKENGGYGSACNVGLNKATGEYVAIVESDDYIDVRMYEDLYKIAKEFDVDVVKGKYYEISENSSYKKLPLFFKDFTGFADKFDITEGSILLNHHASIWSGLYKRELIEKYNIRMFEKNKGRYADQVWRYETLCLAKNIHWVDTPYYYYRIFSQNNTTSIKGAKTPDDIFDLYVELNGFFNNHKDIYEKVKENYFAEIYYHTLFNIKRCDKSCIKYILNKFKTMFSKQIPLDSINNLKILSKKEKLEFISMLKGTYYLEHLTKKVIQFIFAITNSVDKKYKIITILGLKINFKRI